MRLLMLSQAAIDEQKSQPKPDSSKLAKLKSSDVTGLKYFAMLSPLLERLHDDGCLRDKANNRTLHYDQTLLGHS